MHSTEGSRDPALVGTLGGLSFSRVTRRPTECSTRRKARATMHYGIRMADNRTRSPIPESLPTDVVGPYAITELIAMDQAFVAAVVRAIKAGDESAAAASATVRTER